MWWRLAPQVYTLPAAAVVDAFKNERRHDDKTGEPPCGRSPVVWFSIPLKYMEKEGLVHRTVYPEVPPRVEYSLTAMGRRFAPVLDSIQVWGEEYIEFLKENRI